MPLPVIVGIIVGVLSGTWCTFRAATGRNTRLVRNPDGSVYGGLVPIGIGTGILWFLIAAGITWLVMLPF